MRWLFQAVCKLVRVCYVLLVWTQMESSNLCSVAYAARYRVSLGKSESKKPLGRWRYRWMDNINMDLKKIGMGWCGLDWSGSGQRPVEGFLNIIMNCQVCIILEYSWVVGQLRASQEGLSSMWLVGLLASVCCLEFCSSLGVFTHLWVQAYYWNGRETVIIFSAHILNAYAYLDIWTS
jgi:hypothetical protein